HRRRRHRRRRGHGGHPRVVGRVPLSEVGLQRRNILAGVMTPADDSLSMLCYLTVMVLISG
ncbi:MAG: hypothetical protein O2855_07905, partial [Planctomycetota bacterium]|nr:hypothetical protein [Planctomycetota bacterium]